MATGHSTVRVRGEAFHTGRGSETTSLRWEGKVPKVYRIPQASEPDDRGSWLHDRNSSTETSGQHGGGG